VRDLEQLVRAADLHSVPVIVRLPPARLELVGRALETGATGIQVSDVVDSATLAAARGAATYPPAGHRGLALSHRAAGFGQTPPTEYLERAQRELVVVAQIESVAGVEALPSLLGADPAPDAWFLGPADLSASLGYPGESTHQEVLAVLRAAAETIVSHGARLGVFAGNGDDARQWRARGATLVALGSDHMLLAGLASDLVAAWRA
jgi:4-hydroxy-2-oxoheptanedioate aldolase